MRECDVDRVGAVLDVVEVVAGAKVGAAREDAIAFQLRVARQRRWPERSGIAAFGIAQVGEDEAQILLARIARDPHLAGEAGVLGGLLDALAGAVVLPAVVEAADAVPLDPAGAELRPPVRAAERHHVRRAPLVTVEGKVLTHDADRDGSARWQIHCVVDGLPEHPQVPTSERAGAGVDEVSSGN